MKKNLGIIENARKKSRKLKTTKNHPKSGENVIKKILNCLQLPEKNGVSENTRKNFRS